MMTNGPEAFVGEILTVPFPRPRHRKDVLEHPEYYALRETLIEFLNTRAYTLKGQTPPASGHAPEKPASKPAPPEKKPSHAEPIPISTL